MKTGFRILGAVLCFVFLSGVNCPFSGIPGQACWDQNGNGLEDPEEDVNGDGAFDSDDCQGDAGPSGNPVPGPQGGAGLACWDVNGNGVADAGEDVNGDGLVDVLDCQGLQGQPGTPGQPGQPGSSATVSGGSGVTVVNGVVSLDTSVTDARYWKRGGNNGTTPGTDTLGTSDDMPLELVVNGERALRLEPNATSPNVIGGHADNGVVGNVAGATIGGGGTTGILNMVTANYGTVGGGRGNSAGFGDTVGGGRDNTAAGDAATIGGGEGNEASGWAATVPGGSNNRAQGAHSLAAGRNAKADHAGAFVWSDSRNFDFPSTVEDEFRIRATGGIEFVTAVDGSGNPTASACLPPGSGTWGCVSDRNAKNHFALVSSREILDRLSTIRIETWNYRSEDASIRHIGPMSQDFYAAFGVGFDDRHITTVDADGVALAAIQGLHQIVEDRTCEMALLTEENQQQQRRIASLEERIAALEKLLAKTPDHD